jgi:phenylpropionate dioxygenase-like ring-hydroxylating dioxygenase large terminal subunit
VSPLGYPRNAWYVVATSDEVTRGLTARAALDRRLLLFRRTDGTPAVLEDRCAHRALPLSMGRLDGDHVVCAYHGFTYDPSGACVRVPSQEHVPYGAAVRAFPCREQPPFIWVWPGEPGLAAGTAPPRHDEPAGWTSFGGTLPVAASYLLLHENALDRTHLPFVHADDSHRGYHEEPPPQHVEVTETTVSYARGFRPGPLPEWQQRATGLPAGDGYVQRERGVFVSPALHVDHLDVEPPTGPPHRSRFIRAFTPVDTRSTLVFWQVVRDYAIDDDKATTVLRELHERTMAEDHPLLEAIQATTERDGEGPRANASADIAATKVREIVRLMLAVELGVDDVRGLEGKER